MQETKFKNRAYDMTVLPTTRVMLEETTSVTERPTNAYNCVWCLPINILYETDRKQKRNKYVLFHASKKITQTD